MTITPEQIASAWALVNAVTPEPWQAKPSPFEVYNIDHGALPNHIVSGDTMIAALYGDEVDDPNAAFIAASRELVPQLLTALEAVRAKVARLVRALDEIDMRGLQYNPEDLADIARAALTEIKEGK